MPSYQQFARESEDAVLTVRDIDIAITYNPDRITVRDLGDLARIEQTLDFGAAADFLDKLIESWDVTGPVYGEDEDGEPVELVAEGEVVPFTEECVEALGINFVQEFMAELQTAALKGPKSTKATRRSPKRSRGRGRTPATTR